ncbi:MAG: hypothetical protein KJO34_14960 [Deltaproteobacteria bacterium]|nr:hypothetical protein [Deltaproteobacteria bacterium]
MINMADRKKNLKHVPRSFKTNKRPKPDKRWTLLFIGNHGRTITLKRFKGMVLLTLVALTAAIVIAAGLFIWNQSILHEKAVIESKLNSLKASIDSVRHEKDILMTRLVLAESRVQEKLADSPQNKLDEEPIDQDTDDSETVTPSTPAVAKAEPAPDQKQAAPQPDSDRSEINLSVAIENFKATIRPESNTLRVQFKIKNTSPNSQHVSGHAVVVLKGKQILPAHWLSIPGMRLIEGKPSGKKRGYAFGINYFKTMRFTTKAPKFREKYQSAAVYVFTRDGRLLLEQDFAVKLPAIQPSVSTPPSSDELLKALKDTSQ